MATLSKKIRLRTEGVELVTNQSKSDEIVPVSEEKERPDGELILEYEEEDKDDTEEPNCRGWKVAETHDEYTYMLFISDTALNQNIKHLLRNFDSVCVEFDVKTFSNRSLADLKQMGVCHVWVNMKDADGRHWLSLNLRKNKDFKVCVAYTKNKMAKWVQDLSEYADMTTRVDKLDDIRGLNLGDIVENIGKVLLHEPVQSGILSCISGGKGLLTAKKKKK